MSSLRWQISGIDLGVSVDKVVARGIGGDLVKEGLVGKGKRLRALIRAGGPVVLPGAVSAMTAKLVEAAGFEAVYMTGYGTSLSLLGLPDMGLTSMTEMVANAGYMAQAVEIPLLADADTGYGNALNVRRTVHAFIRAGVAGIHLEDQVSPKRCGGVAGREVISVEEMVGKLRAALEARAELDPEFVIVGRTDALGAANGGLEEAIRRNKAYLEAGADAVMIADAALNSLETLRAIGHSIVGPFVFAPSRLRLTVTGQELRDSGVKAVVYPLETTVVGAIADWEFLRDLHANHDTAVQRYYECVVDHPLGSMAGWHAFAGFPEGLKWLERYSDAEAKPGSGWRPT